MVLAVADRTTVISSSSTTTSYSASYNNAGGIDTVMLVKISGVTNTTGGTVGASITYNGVALTEIIAADSSTRPWAGLYFLINPATGSNTLAVTTNTSNRACLVRVEVYTGADQIDPIGDSASGIGNYSVSDNLGSITTTSDGSIVSSHANFEGDAGTFTETGDGALDTSATTGTARYSDCDVGFGYQAVASSSTTVTHEFTNSLGSSRNYGACSVEILAAASGPDHVLLADDTVSASEESAPVLGQVHGLTSTNALSTSDLSIPVVGQVHNLFGNDVEAASSLSSPAAGQSHVLTSDDVEAASGVSVPVVGQSHVLAGADVQALPEIAAPIVRQSHALFASDLESASEVSAPVLASGVDHALLAGDIQSASELSIPVVGQVHVLAADDMGTASETTVPAISQAQTLTVVGVESASVVSGPVIWQAHSLLADDAESASEVLSPTLSSGVDHILAANDVEAPSQVSVPAVAQVHVLFAASVRSASEVSSPVVTINGGFDPRVSITGTPFGPAIVTGAPATPLLILGSPAGPVAIIGEYIVDATNITDFYFGEPIEVQLFAKAPGGANVISTPASQTIKVTVSLTRGGASVLDFNDKFTLVNATTGEFKILLAASDYETVLSEARPYYFNIWSQLAASDPRLQAWGVLEMGGAIAAA